MISNVPVSMAEAPTGRPMANARQETMVRPEPTNLLPPPPTQRTTNTRPATASRVHTVAAGETLALIARRYGIKVSTLQTANPRVDARKLKPGQTLVIPIQ